MKISAQIIADSHDGLGNRITTMLCTFPRFILAELNTHRMFSRNSASSRAIPFNTMLKTVKENPFIPYAWQKDHKGMQGTEYFEGEAQVSEIEMRWLRSRDLAVEQAIALNSTGVTKQLVNRVMEPFMYHTALITSTEWENFFTLRCPQYAYLEEDMSVIYFRSKKDYMKYDATKKGDVAPLEFSKLGWLMNNKGQAEIHIMELAEQIWDAMNGSMPHLLEEGEWHLPYWEEIGGKVLLRDLLDYNPNKIPEAVKVSTVMAARTSYTIPEGELSEWSDKKYLTKYDELKVSRHASPFEHCAKRMNKYEYHNSGIQIPNDPDVGSGIIHTGWCRNFRGFIQLRALEGL